MSAPVFVKDILSIIAAGIWSFVSPDVGGVLRARDVARRLDADLVIVEQASRAGGEFPRL